MTESDAYERIGAGGALLTATIALGKLGVFRAIRAWWNRPTDTARLSKALEDISDVVGKMGRSLEEVSRTMIAMADASIVSEAMTRALADRDPLPMYQCELPSGRCVWTNRALQKMFGRTKEQMLGTGWAEAIVPSFQDTVIHHWKNAIVNSEIYNQDYPIEVNGKLLNVRAHADFIADTTGRKVIAIGTVREMPVIQEAA